MKILAKNGARLRAVVWGESKFGTGVHSENLIPVGVTPSIET